MKQKSSQNTVKITGISEIVKNYSIRNDRKIKKICEPLVDHLDIPVFAYYFVEADGSFGFLTNSLDFNSYYFEENIYLANPYFAHPAFFRSGYAMLPCSSDEETQKKLNIRFSADHMFLHVKTNSNVMESFIFANLHEGLKDGQNYMMKIDLLDKFCKYFKRETSDLIQKMKGAHYNIKEERGESLFESAPDVPLAAYDPKVKNFLKKVTGLSRQEQICLEHFQQGKSAQATGALMNLSQRTVESYFESIKNKLGCSSKYDLLDY